MFRNDFCRWNKRNSEKNLDKARNHLVFNSCQRDMESRVAFQSFHYRFKQFVTFRGQEERQNVSVYIVWLHFCLQLHPCSHGDVTRCRSPSGPCRLTIMSEKLPLCYASRCTASSRFDSLPCRAWCRVQPSQKQCLVVFHFWQPVVKTDFKYSCMLHNIKYWVLFTCLWDLICGSERIFGLDDMQGGGTGISACLRGRNRFETQAHIEW